MRTVTFAQALALALLQGVSELFPVSSLGHTILVPAVLGWRNVDRSAPTFLAFVVVLHLGTALALVWFYRRDWLQLVRALLRTIARGKIGDDRSERIVWLLVVGTIPVGILGLLFQNDVLQLFGFAAVTAGLLIVNGLVMFLGEYLRSKQRRDVGRSSKPLEQLTWSQSIFVGLCQSLALLPGISRSGASIVGGLLADLDHEHAAKYSFLLATPVILAAAVLKMPELFAPGAHVVLAQAIAGGIVAGVAAYFSVAFLTRYFRTNDLRPFGWYCIAFGVLCVILARMGVIH